MSEIQPYNSLLPSVRTSRTINRISNNTTIASATISAKAELEVAKADGISAVAAKAMQNVALLSQMEQSLAQTVPHASGRLAVIADLTAMALADVVDNRCTTDRPLMATVIGVAFLTVLVVGIGVTLWVAWPTLQAVRERQRVEYEARQGLLRVQQATYSAMDRLLREARSSSATPPVKTFVQSVDDEQ